MRDILKFFVLACFFLTPLITFAQKGAEEVIEDEATESSAPETMYLDDIVDESLIVNNTALAYKSIRPADVSWKKKMWRVIETREKMNLPFRYPEKPFFNILKEEIENGNVTAFDDEKFENPLTIEDIDGKLNDLDTIMVFDYDTYEENIKVVKNTIDWNSIFKFRIKEVWFFDEQASMLRNRILGIAPIRLQVDEEYGYELEIPLFWIYYPEAREAFSKHRVFNDNNDMAPMTWADLFDSRFFSSIIYKRSNVLDYRIEDYFDPNDEMAGVNKLLESEKIKQELFNFEHDLWTY